MILAYSEVRTRTRCQLRIEKKGRPRRTNHLRLKLKTGVVQLEFTEHGRDDATEPSNSAAGRHCGNQGTAVGDVPHDLDLSVTPSRAGSGTHHERPRLERRGVFVALEVEPPVRSEGGQIDHQY